MKTKDQKIFSEWISEKLTNRSQASLARELDVNRSTINHWCTGTRIPSAEMKEKISESSLFDSTRYSLSFLLHACHNQEMTKISDQRVDEIAEKANPTDEDIEILVDWVEQVKKEVTT